MNIDYEKNSILITGIPFDIKKTFECGQCFRFDKTENGFEGVAHGKLLTLTQTEGTVSIAGIDKTEFENTFYNYFDLSRDYTEIDRVLSEDVVLKPIIPFSSGIRILNQAPFETLVSFIISASNNIPRIKKIISALCENFGDKYMSSGRVYYSFPTAKRLADLDISDLSVIRAGFRDKYILDCALKVSRGEIDVEKIPQMTYEDAKRELMKINGIGEKVADCALLFAFGFINSFPKDVWIKRILKAYYGTETETGLDFHGYGGIAQQYLFYYARETSLKI